MSKSIFITGASGFVGSNLIEKLTGSYQIHRYIRTEPIEIKQDIVIHLAGKAHDLINTSSPDEYYKANTALTCQLFDAFLTSDAHCFITLSTVKAVADSINGMLTEEQIPNPITHYGKSKLQAEQYILSKEIPPHKKVFILRPCLIHGPGNKGNLNLLYKIVSKGIPWPLAAFDNKRSFCSIENLLFAIEQLIDKDTIPSGVYNIADDDPLSTNELINIMGKAIGKKPILWKIPSSFIQKLAKLGDVLHLPLNSERLGKLTESYVVSNSKIKLQLNTKLPVSVQEGLQNTFSSFKKNNK